MTRAFLIRFQWVYTRTLLEFAEKHLRRADTGVFRVRGVVMDDLLEQNSSNSHVNSVLKVVFSLLNLHLYFTRNRKSQELSLKSKYLSMMFHTTLMDVEYRTRDIQLAYNGKFYLIFLVKCLR